MKVFISYSHDSSEHKCRVHQLADRLKNDGINVVLDRDCPPEGPSEGWPKWSEQTAEQSDIVLSIFTESYALCWNGQQSQGMRLGATHETKVIHDRVYRAAQQIDFLRVVVFSRVDKSHVPSVIKGLKSFNATEETDYSALLEWLRRVTGAATTPVVEFEVERNELFLPLLEYAKQRPIVFGVGGVGSGLNTFTRQFREFLHANHVHTYTAPDFDEAVFKIIFDARDQISKLYKGMLISSARDHLELKCLYATLAYSTYHILRQEYSYLIDHVIPSRCGDNPVAFAEYYFSHSDAMGKADLGPIVEYFFDTLQLLANTTGIDGIVVLMPLNELARLFGTSEPSNLAKFLWESLSDLYVRDRQSKSGHEKVASKYNKVCVLTNVNTIFLGTSPHKRLLVHSSVWPVPPLSLLDTGKLIAFVCPELKDDLDAHQLIANWTGGAPILTKIVLSFLRNSLDSNSANAPTRNVLAACLRRAEECLKNGGNDVGEPLRRFIEGYLARVKVALRDGTAEDARIEAAWAGPERKRRSGLERCPLRVEAFVASGLTWFEGETWNPFPELTYPTVCFRKASKLAIAAYSYATNNDLIWQEV